MDWYKDFRLVEDNGQYTVIINLNPEFTEFSGELGSSLKEKVLNLDDQIRKLVKEKFSNIKINTVKLLLGSMIVASIPFASNAVTAKTATGTSSSSQQSATTKGTVTASKLNVRSGPGTNYDSIHTLWQGNVVTVLEQSNGWYKIQLSNGKTGWVSGTYLQVSGTENPVKSLSNTGTVTASKLNVRSGPDTSYSIIHTLWQGNTIKVIGESNGWYKIQLSNGTTGWVSGTYLKLGASTATPTPTPSAPTATSRAEKINTIISTAKSLVGTPYVWGGESLQEGGFDCSGLTYYVFKKVGITLNRVSADQAKQGTTVSRANLQPGDLVFYSFQGTSKVDHVGIYIGNNKMIHSPKAGDTVKITDISTSYWESRLVVAKRIL
ncbi:Gamma-D-glutamyl-L-lysine endopeptidase [Clostridium sp. N3C]|uniref:C40 family peptidase n=1 Tax=Clostridium sp. N3C TaxID=1776758 RepID=UPI00092E05DB|nr:C40 family peptidase [Clostridium sp. N3C]SCN25300.1 Gamma-D-glutamyl-L-lysine endopeptidase [Clostridium sp. N3C]